MRFLVAFTFWGLCGCEPDPTAAFLETLEAERERYATWPQRDPWIGVQTSLDGTHGPVVQVFFDPAAGAVIEAGEGGAMPEGAMAFKEGYADEEGEEIAAIVATLRTEAGNLFFAMWSPEGTLLESGRPRGCTDCHAMGQDEVMAVTW